MEEKINVNQADLEQLMQLSGVGPAVAAKIIEYRTTVHPFEEVIELAAVPGISERMVRAFEAQVTVGAVASTDEPIIPPKALSEEDALEPVETVPGDSTDEAEAIENELVVAERAIVPVEPDGAALTEQGDSDSAPALQGESTAMGDDAETAQSNIEAETPPREGRAAVASDRTAAPHDAEEPRPAAPALSIIDTEPSEEIPPADDLSPTDKPEQEPLMNEEPETPVIPPRSPESENVSRQRGCVFIIIGAVAGAILGTTLTLALLYALNNNSLEYANQQVESQIRQAESDLERLTGTLEAVRGDVGDISTQADTFAEAQTSLSTMLDDVATSVDELETDIGTVENEIDSLEETTVDLDERLDTVASSAETFDAFLEGMRVLLSELSGTETAVSPTQTITTTVTTTPTEMPGTATPTQVPTRTPRPTATPIVLPTPEQQP